LLLLAIRLIPAFQEVDVGHHVMGDPQAAAAGDRLVELAVLVHLPSLFQVYVSPPGIDGAKRPTGKHATNHPLSIFEMDPHVVGSPRMHHEVPGARHSVDVAKADEVEGFLNPRHQSESAGDDSQDQGRKEGNNRCSRKDFPSTLKERPRAVVVHDPAGPKEREAEDHGAGGDDRQEETDVRWFLDVGNDSPGDLSEDVAR
jgi:hypothetical protein